jgi:hypothetical protein
MRHELNGSNDDKNAGSAMLAAACVELPADHPALPIVERNLAYLSLTWSNGSS